MSDNKTNNTNNNTNLGFLASRILDVPLMVTQTKLDQVLYVVSDRIGLDRTILVTPKAEVMQARRSSPEYRVNKSTAIIPIYGTLVNRARGLSALSGITSYESIRAQFDDAMASPDIDNILLDIDSPGGEVAGVFDLVDHIYASRGRKPITAMINERGYSAAYAIASAADQIILTRTAGVGSIGVIMLHVDRSEANKKAGITYTPIYAGERKIDGSPNAPLSDKARTDAQTLVDSVYSLFISTVSRNLGLSESTIRKTQAATYHGQSAIDIGLAHRILPYQEVVNQLATNKGGIIATMPKEKDTQLNDGITDGSDLPPTSKAEKPVEAQAQPSTPPETPPAPPTQAQFDQAVIDSAVAAERDRCLDILEACRIANVPTASIDLISDGSSLETAHKMIMNMMAERSKAQSVVSAINPQHSGNKNPLLEDAKRRAARAKA